MFTDPLLEYQLNRSLHDELVREAERERLASQIQATARVAPAIWSSLQSLAGVAGGLASCAARSRWRTKLTARLQQLAFGR